MYKFTISLTQHHCLNINMCHGAGSAKLLLVLIFFLIRYFINSAPHHINGREKEREREREKETEMEREGEREGERGRGRVREGEGEEWHNRACPGICSGGSK